MTYRLQVTDEARQLLLQAAQWYARTSQSIEIAITWYDGFIDALEKLEKNPNGGPLAPENDLFPFELRELHYGSGRRATHRAIYRVVENRVEVLSIRHLAQRPLSPKDV
jgi:plasmid stabilization system protein ParE